MEQPQPFFVLFLENEILPQSGDEQKLGASTDKKKDD